MKVSVHQAKTQFSKLLKRVAAGEEVVILHRDRPVARVVPFQRKTVRDLKGDLKGQVRLAEDFDALPPGFEDYT